MTDITTVIVLAQFERYPIMLKKRKIKKYNAAFKSLGVEVLNHYTDDYTLASHLFTTRVPGEGDKKRKEIVIKMIEAEMDCNVHYKPLPMYTGYMKTGFSIENYPTSYGRHENEITLPLHTKLTNEEVEYVISKFVEILFD
jgi:dTDP-4-amino-4,6-dideoxygalactose transaminase